MELSPEERRRIYEEEKARIEAREQIERERRGVSPETGTGLEPNIAGLLCYIGGWITGLIFFILEPKNNWVRFHAAQSIVTFGAITVAGILLGWIPVIGSVFAVLISLLGFILWVVLIVKAHRGERYHLPWAGEIAERMVAPASDDNRPSPPVPPGPPRHAEAAPAEPLPSSWAPRAGRDWERRIDRKMDDFFKYRREGRITASAFAIAWSIALLIFFNFFNGYVALYYRETAGGTIRLVRQPFFTSAIGLWLPILDATLLISIIGHIFLIIFDRPLLRQVVHIVIDVFAVATVVSLLAIFPFDFSIIPDATVAGGVHIGVIVFLVCVAVGMGIGILVRVVKLIVNLVRGIIG
jgi:uncharacterized membrane protein